ncbi:MAG: DUF1254 domain-containing protein, partial [Gammaproteobacteria bacterium]
MKNLLLATACSALLSATSSSADPQGISAQEAQDIAREAFVYAYPLVLSQLTFQIGTNVAEPTSTLAPVNQFGHMREFPDPSFTIVVRPNSDTLYSPLSYDVSREPLVVSIPDAGDR